MKLYDFRKLERDGYYKDNPEVYLYDALEVIKNCQILLGCTSCPIKTTPTPYDRF